MTVVEFIQSFGIQITEGGCDEVQGKWFEDWFQRHPEVRTVLEIGFNAGQWTEVVLRAHPTLKITSVDLGCHDYVSKAKDYIDQVFPGRHELLLGDSRVVIPTITKKFDVIFIDGGHFHGIPEADILNCKELAYPHTTLIIDDFGNYHGQEVLKDFQKVDALGFIKHPYRVIGSKDPQDPNGKTWFLGQYEETRIVVINAYNRAEYLERCLEQLSQNEDLEKWSIIYHQDGLKEGGFHQPTADVANKWLDVCAKRCKYVYRHFYTENKNIGCRQYDALVDAFYNKKADYLCLMEDDLVPSKTYLKTLYNLMVYTTDDPTVGIVGGNYWNKHPEKGGDNDVIHAPAFRNYQTTWLTGHQKFKFKQMFSYYQIGHAKIFANRPYQPTGAETWATYLKHWDKVFEELGLEKSVCYCQDELQMRCYIKAGVGYIVFPLKRHALPIGKEGLHFTKDIFDKSGLDCETPDWEHPAWEPSAEENCVKIYRN
jgi:glycosyltransferase involved in cell wall biosynthesis